PAMPRPSPPWKRSASATSPPIGLLTSTSSRWPRWTASCGPRACANAFVLPARPWNMPPATTPPTPPLSQSEEAMYRYDEFDHAFVHGRVEQFRDQVGRRLSGRSEERRVGNECR